MICPICGNEIPDGSAFCGFCGGTIPQASPAPVNPVAEQPAAPFTPMPTPVPSPAPMPVSAPVPETVFTQPTGGYPVPPAPIAPRVQNTYYRQPAPGMFYQSQTPIQSQGYASVAPAPKPTKIYNTTPISSWGYIGWSLLFLIPVIGQIVLIVFACGGTRNMNLRNYARSKLLTLLLLVIIALILTVVYFVTGQKIHLYWNLVY